MKFVQKEFSSTFEEKKSKFIAHLCPFPLFDEIMKRLKEEHPKARHHVYAYRYLNEFDQIVENSSDDGEPKGTSGKPCLSVLAGSDLINTAVIVVRYFGGVKLGTGGLVRAYSDAVNHVIKEAQLNEFLKLEQKSITLSYAQLSQLEYLLSRHKISIIDKLFEEGVTLKLEGTQEQFGLLETLLPLNVTLQ
ncbi:MAG: YigZ family protein [Candidatus Marinarcus sp.]|uniref:YigZ family protein n=1 Tax=Candidatus Marinarcus sp. TaxID=3100987 RepID=UPI003AFF72CB